MTIAIASQFQSIVLTTQTYATGTVAQAIALTTSTGTTTSILVFPNNASVPASASVSPYLQFPSFPPPPITINPVIRMIIHNDSSNGTPVQPTLLNANNTLYAGNGGNLPRVEPGNRTAGGGTSWGTINMSIPGIPTAGMKIAVQNLVTGDPGGFSVSILAWMA